MAYCDRCGAWAALDPAAMCGNCRDNWQPAGDRPRDLGYHGLLRLASGRDDG